MIRFSMSKRRTAVVSVLAAHGGVLAVRPVIVGHARDRERRHGREGEGAGETR